tara:strand:- start:272 stop:817 length:546 start_codon:yes stop_codon:yes gene_type:complete
MNNNKTILGIDPGTNIMGYGLIKKTNSKIEFVFLDVVILKNFNDHNLKLKKIFETTNDIIKRFKPDELAIEAPFFGKNPQSMLKLGRAQGAAMIAGVINNLPMTEYAPKKIKMSITGDGNSSKEKVSGMLMNMLKIKEKPKFLDATDGLAAAVCHALQRNVIVKKAESWKDYIMKNPKRVN